jgi:hypothetical protein
LAKLKYRDLHGSVVINGRKRAGAMSEPPLGTVGYRQSSCFIPIGGLEKFIPSRLVGRVAVAQLQHTILVITHENFTWALVLATFFQKSAPTLSYDTVSRNPLCKAYIPITCVGPRAMLARDFDNREQLVIIPLPDRPGECLGQ